MKGALAIGLSEARRHRLLLWIAPLLGVLPLVVRYLVYGTPARPSPVGGEWADVEPFVWILAYLLSTAIAVGLGSEAFSHDLRERRLGFWLSRPLPVFQYWVGKLAAAWLLAVLAAVLVMLPSHLLGSLSWADTAEALRRPIGWRGWPLLLALLVAGTSVASGFFRGRSRLLGLDIVMVPVLWVAAGLALGRATQMGTGGVVLVAGIPWVIRGAVLVLLAASAVQICVGRLDIARGRRWLSGLTWGGLLLLLAGGILGFGRHVAAEPATGLLFPWVSVSAPPAGPYAMLTGISRRWEGHSLGYALDDRTGARPLSGLDGITGWAWSRDGRRLALSSGGFFPEESNTRPPSFLGLGPDVAVHDVKPPGEVIERFGLPETGTVVDFSPSGQRLLVLGDTHRVVDAATGEELASLQDPLGWHQAAFVSETVIRALREDPLRVGGTADEFTQRVLVVEWDTSAGATERGSIVTQGPVVSTMLRPVENWEKLLRLDGRGLSLLDLDGSVTADLVEGWSTPGPRKAGPLSGGRYGLIEEGPSELRIRAFDGAGGTLWDARLAGRFPVLVGAEPAPDQLALAVTPRLGAGRLETLIVDLETGQLLRHQPDVQPALSGWGQGGLYGSVYPEPGSLGSRLFLGNDGLVSMDPTGGTTVLVRRSRLSER